MTKPFRKWRRGFLPTFVSFWLLLAAGGAAWLVAAGGEDPGAVPYLLSWLMLDASPWAASLAGAWWMGRKEASSWRLLGMSSPGVSMAATLPAAAICFLVAVPLTILAPWSADLVKGGTPHESSVLLNDTIWLARTSRRGSWEAEAAIQWSPSQKPVPCPSPETFTAAASPPGTVSPLVLSRSDSEKDKINALKILVKPLTILVLAPAGAYLGLTWGRRRGMAAALAMATTVAAMTNIWR